MEKCKICVSCERHGATCWSQIVHGYQVIPCGACVTRQLCASCDWKVPGRLVVVVTMWNRHRGQTAAAAEAEWNLCGLTCDSPVFENLWLTLTSSKTVYYFASRSLRPLFKNSITFQFVSASEQETTEPNSIHLGAAPASVFITASFQQ